MRNMTYKVVITPHAKSQLEQYIAYTIKSFKNKQAARAIRDDAIKTRQRLSDIAPSLALCENAVLAAQGYRKISFTRHPFFMVYRINGKHVIVEAMYHELQDYESVFAHKVSTQ